MFTDRLCTLPPLVTVVRTGLVVCLCSSLQSLNQSSLLGLFEVQTPRLGWPPLSWPSGWSSIACHVHPGPGPSLACLQWPMVSHKWHASSEHRPISASRLFRLFASSARAVAEHDCAVLVNARNECFRDPGRRPELSAPSTSSFPCVAAVALPSSRCTCMQPLHPHSRCFPHALQPLHSLAVAFSRGGWVFLPLAHTGTSGPIVSVQWAPSGGGGARAAAEPAEAWHLL